ncbi:MAG: hypothetical protein C0501_23805 [Isosphaera sp.]|nr:hypothetical protein [Isosphaera sp.]
MTPNEIRNWQPRRFSEVIGTANRPAVERLQRAARNRDVLTPLLVGPFGTAKTSLARLVLQSYCCERPDPITADPCGSCGGCLGCCPEKNGSGAPLQHWVFDCGEGVGKDEVVGFVRAYQFHDKNAVLFDEIGELPAPAQKALRRYLSPLRGGLFVATLTLDGTADRLVKSVIDRLDPVALFKPTADELVAFLETLAGEAGVQMEQGAVHDLVTRLSGSFRQCLQELADSARRTDRTLRWPAVGAFTPDPESDPEELPGDDVPMPPSPFTSDGW